MKLGLPLVQLKLDAVEEQVVAVVAVAAELVQKDYLFYLQLLVLVQLQRLAAMVAV